MVTQNVREYIWVEKYRPATIDECILPEATKAAAKSYVDQGRIQNLLFHGGAGVGKTTLAKAICNELGADWILINASNENGIDTFRTKIMQFATTVSFSDSKKVVILDEFDQATPAMQAALRAGMEEVSSNCSFILSCNFPNRIIDPIHSRCGVINFKIPNSERSSLAAKFFKRLLDILAAEGVEYDKAVVAELVKKYFPDFRRCLNELQKYSVGGKIDSGILLGIDSASFEILITALKAKKFNDVRKWCAENIDSDPSAMFRRFYDTSQDYIESKSIPELILLISDYQFKASQVADQEINAVAFMLEIMMSNIVWK